MRKSLNFALLTMVLCVCRCTDTNSMLLEDDAGVDMTAGAPRCPSDMAPAAPGCRESLGGVGTGDFLIKFKISTTAMVASTVLYQRATCDALHDLWDLSLTKDGFLRLGLIESGVKYTDYTSSLAVNDGQPHRVTVSRVDQVITIATDSNPAGSVSAPQKLGALPPLGVGMGNPCEVTGIKPLAGTLSDICLRAF